MDIFPIPILSDNYVWVLHQQGQAFVTDPGDGAIVQAVLAQRKLALAGVLITHWHPDHIGGLPVLLKDGQVPIYGPAAEAGRIRLLTHQLQDGDTVNVLGSTFEVLGLPGHTLGHIAYRHEDALLCGDTLFSAGCGRLFEGTPDQMFASLSRLSRLSPETQVYCTHEYTSANLAFAREVEPDNPDLITYSAQVRNWRGSGIPSLPSNLALESRINPFLRCHLPAVHAKAQTQAGRSLKGPAEVFAALRAWKDQFRS